LREESEKQRGHVVQGKWARFPRKFFCEFLAEIFFYCGRLYYTDPYSPYDSVQSYGFGIEIEVIFGTIFEDFFRFSVAIFGPYRTIRTMNYGHEK
jgi:hypothetical protein